MRISWFEVVSRWVIDIFTASASTGLSDYFLKNLKFLKLFCQKCLNVLDFVEQHFVGHLCFISFSFTSEIFFKKSAILSKSQNLLVFVEQRFCRPLLSLRQEWFTREATLCFTTQQITNNNSICFWIFYVLQPDKLQTILQSAFWIFYVLQPNKLQTIF